MNLKTLKTILASSKGEKPKQIPTAEMLVKQVKKEQRRIFK